MFQDTNQHHHRMEYLSNLPYSSISDALEYQSKTRPDKIALLYPDPNEHSRSYASLTYKQYNNLTNLLAEKISKYLPCCSSNEQFTCGLLSIGGLEYLLSQYALLKLPNVIMFPISARNSPSAIEYLLKETRTILLLTTTHYLSMIKTIQEQNQQLQSMKILLLDTEQFQIEKLLLKKDLECSSPYLTMNNQTRDEQFNQVVVILHSSGSTSHPRPIRLTNRYFLISFAIYLSINKEFWQENDVILTWGALFHLLAFNGTVRAIVTGCTYALPLCLTFPPKPDELLNNIQIHHGITVLVTVPSLLEQLVRELLSEENTSMGLKPLQKLKFVMYGGAGCPDQLCQILVDHGVILLSVYGATETGIVLVNNYKPYNRRWKSMQLSDIRKRFIRIETPVNGQTPNERILIHLPTDPFLAENISNSSDDCYIVGDILLEDPPNSGDYQILGRQDDTLVHITGEKTNPIPIEETIRRLSLVEQVVVIGHNQFSPAVLIQLNLVESSKYNSKEIENILWKIIEEANKESPSHSRIVRQLMKILPTNEILPVTHKGNLMRQKINQDYSQLIIELYDQFLNKQYEEKKKVRKETHWTKDQIEEYLQAKCPLVIDCSRSIFDYGLNSLQILELRNHICQEICFIPLNFLYEYSSIDQLTEKLFDSLQSGLIDNDQDYAQLTEQIIDQYIHSIQTNPIPRRDDQRERERERVFLLTGANGSLGNYILRDLLQQSKTLVKRIYCLLRGSNPLERLIESFLQRQFDPLILIQSIEEQRLILLSSSMTFTDEVKNNLTDLIHSAWKMNFNQTIRDFQSDCLDGLYHLLQLCSFNSIRFHFISSISSASSGLIPLIKEERLPRQPNLSLSQGYGQSKYASEHICYAANQFWNIPISIYRIGQISGDTQTGVWNSSEMAAMMIYAGAGQLHQMPNQGEEINWIPVNICSQAFIQLIFHHSNEEDFNIYHLLNPQTIEYQDYLILLTNAGLDFNLVSKEEFLQSILQTNDQINPLKKLSSFLQQRFEKKIHLKSSRFELTKTIDACPALQQCPPIDSNLIRLYLNYWNKSSNLSQT